MVDILHKIIIKTSPQKLYTALTTREGLAGWWTPMTAAQPQEGSRATFRFGDGELGPDMQIVDLQPGKYVEWLCTGGIPEWVGTRFTFDVRPHEEGSELLFGHREWKQPSECYMHCNSQWGFSPTGV